MIQETIFAFCYQKRYLFKIMTQKIRHNMLSHLSVLRNADASVGNIDSSSSSCHLLCS